MNVPCCCESNVRSVYLSEAFLRIGDEVAKIFKSFAVRQRRWID